MAMFAARMVKDGVIKMGGAELGRAILKLVPSVDCNRMNPLVTGMAMFAARIVEDGVIKMGGAELGRAILKLVPSVDCNLMNPFFRLSNGSTKGSLGRVHIVDDEMEVKRKMRG